MAESKYEKYIRRDVQLKGVQQLHPEVTKPVLSLTSDETFGNHNFSLSWWPISEPFEMVSQTHAHDFDQFLLFIGGDINNMLDLGGEVELTLSEDGKNLEKLVFTTATMVYIPAGLYHCPLNFKKVNDPNKPILFHDFFLSPEYKRRD
jgi:hypothetical protein